MYMRSALPFPGMLARTPSMFGALGESQTLTVAHRSFRADALAGLALRAALSPRAAWR
jgi:hypothetical protein